jgi:hypothetical protein
MKDNYSTSIIKMEQFEPFNHYHDNMRGILWPENNRGNIQLIKYYEFDYNIYSYTTMMCFVNFRREFYCINPHKYSTTTSKQVSYIMRAARVWESKEFERILWI